MRRAGWEQRFRDLIEGARSRPFEYGVHDCCTFGLADIEAVRGVRPKAPGWRNELEADRLLAQKNLAAWCDQMVGIENRAAGWLDARRGDILLISHPASPIVDDLITFVAVCCGENCAVVTPGGLGFLPTKRASKVWKVD